MDFYNSGGITRRFLYNTQINLDSSNVEPISAEVQAFQEYLKFELDAMKQKLDQTKNHAIEKDGYMKLRIDELNGSQIRFPLKDVKACKKIQFKWVVKRNFNSKHTWTPPHNKQIFGKSENYLQNDRKLRKINTFNQLRNSCIIR